MWVWIITVAAGAAGYAAARYTSRRSQERPRLPVVPIYPAESPDGPIGPVTVISGLAHELRNPLSNLKLNLQLLREDLNRLLDDQRDQPPQRRILGRLETAVGEAGRLERTLERFLQFASNPRLEMCEAEVNGLVAELLEFFSPQAAAHLITIRSQVADVALPCRLDPVLFKQAVLNLLINAQQAMAGGGELIVRTQVAPDPLCMQLHVIDTGAGVPPERIDKIFQAYYSTRRGGTGLGLSISRKIIQAHGGTLAVHSVPGKGSDFWIELPLCRQIG